MPTRPTKLTIKPARSRTQFKKALSELASDKIFRDRALKNPEVLIKKYKLSIKELEALREVAVMSGVDIKAVDRLRGKEILDRAGTGSVADVDVSCCSCCCCCCGETAVAPVIHFAR